VCALKSSHCPPVSRLLVRFYPGPPQSSLHHATVKRTRNHALWNHFRPYRYVPCAEVRGRKRRSGAVSRFFHLRVLCAVARGPAELRYPACSGAWRPIRLVVTRTEARLGRGQEGVANNTLETCDSKNGLISTFPGAGACHPLFKEWLLIQDLANSVPLSRKAAGLRCLELDRRRFKPIIVSKAKQYN
jgi:hypothetical protein